MISVWGWSVSVDGEMFDWLIGTPKLFGRKIHLSNK